MNRLDGRNFDELRKVNIVRDYLKYPQGSVLIEMGDTKIICTAMVEERVPHFLKGSNQGWITAEYSMLPGSTATRKIREAARRRIEGRTQEIQRMIGRVLRTVVDLKSIGERTVWIDCDVIQADGGTRTASITGAYVALADALHGLYKDEKIKKFPLLDFVSAVSVGVVKGDVLLDLCFEEDFKAEVDMNIAMTGSEEFIEIQGTGEENAFPRNQLDDLLDLSESGNKLLIEKQKEVLADIKDLIEENIEGESGD